MSIIFVCAGNPCKSWTCPFVEGMCRCPHLELFASVCPISLMCNQYLSRTTLDKGNTYTHNQPGHRSTALYYLIASHINQIMRISILEVGPEITPIMSGSLLCRTIAHLPHMAYYMSHWRGSAGRNWAGNQSKMVVRISRLLKSL